MNEGAKEPKMRERPDVRTRMRDFVDRIPWLSAAVNSNILWGVVFTALLVALLLPTQPLQGDRYNLDEIAQEMIVAPRDMSIPDTQASEARRQERTSAIKSVYRFQDNAWRDHVSRIEALFQLGRQAITAPVPYAEEPGATPALPLYEDEEFLSALEEIIGTDIGINVPRDVLVMLVKSGFGLSLQDRITDIVSSILRRPVVNTTLSPPLSAGYELRPASGDETAAKMEILPLRDALLDLRNRATVELEQIPSHDRRLLAEWLQTMIVETAVLDQAEVNRRMAEARDITLYTSIKKGEVLARPGDKIADAETLTKINHVIGARARGIDYMMRAVSLVLFTAFLLYTLAKFCQFYFRRQKINYNIFLLVCLTLAINLTAVKLSMRIADAFSSDFTATLSQNAETFYWIVPFAAGSMLMALLVGSEIAALYSIVSIIFSTIVFNGSFSILLYALIGCLTAIYGLRQYRERSALIKSGLALGLMNVIAILTISLYTEQIGDAGSIAFELGMGFLGGLVAAAVAQIVLPLLESVFQITTDIKLLELSNHEHPLLRELFIKAPGTFQHSIMVGYLAEAAAASIRGNSLFCRVACLYHDIGKMLKASYFVENTNDDIGNKHKDLSPHMSSLIITSHVKEGVELARRYRLPESIVDIIPQHHGTKLIRYFFEKEKARRKPELGPVAEDEFRYPGPKPQTREAGIIMIADSVEAAARTLDNPTTARLKGAIQTIIENTFLDGQLDECDLTLKDLNYISEAFLKVLASMHHERIKYPGVDLERKRERRPKQPAKEAKEKPAAESTDDSLATARRTQPLVIEPEAADGPKSGE